ncbi:fungal-specific transcription factor domain-containing protein [Thelonectria olida]|uniref:Fungal-specific transcription factor domain-containing protein n=1 Tax=Thelonectria olida TaxID=1576542 RepID=A0A9P8VQ34_9HYPO|nr:fungal-specific transcription factor domain-containing protein [Thelonectria olida]
MGPLPQVPGLTSPYQLQWNFSEDLGPCWVSAYSINLAMQPAGLDPFPVLSSLPPPLAHQPSQPPNLPWPLPAAKAKSREAIHSQDTEDTPKCRPLPKSLISPFTDVQDLLVPRTAPLYVRPENGQVNGYIKFNWPSTRPSRRPSMGSSVVVEKVVYDSTRMSTVSTSRVVNLAGQASTPAKVKGVTAPLGDIASVPSMCSSPQESSMRLVTTGEPQVSPPHFGFQANMDRMDMQLSQFYVNNWCPGRSILSSTNSWLKDFAQMDENEGIRCAIQSLAGVYIYDYLPDERIRQRTNERHVLADAHFSKLLTTLKSTEAKKRSEAVTMAIILSIQDVVLTERHLKKPHSPRWLEGFKKGEHFLDLTDPGHLSWHANSTPLTSLHISQSIIVGRALILTQTMMQPPSPAALDPTQEASRFSWLLCGTGKDLYEIHGGCGFSRKLLYTISQITYCTARLQQESDSMIVPITAGYLYRELLEMRQWSSEFIPWDVAHECPQTIVQVRKKPNDYIISTDEDMTDVTAEAWRFAVIIYLQCRLLRLPRNHPHVLANLTDLAKCIRIMPTSGPRFTAQAPLLPVFFLGMLATQPDHKQASRAWFEQVVRTPVRSSVPPLYRVLQRIWAWIDAEIEIPSMPTQLPKTIGRRLPWWEYLIAKIHEKEEETLCLT